MTSVHVEHDEPRRCRGCTADATGEDIDVHPDCPEHGDAAEDRWRAERVAAGLPPEATDDDGEPF